MNKKNRKKLTKIAEADLAIQELSIKPAQAPKQLIVTPQIPVSLHGTAPDQYLTVELFNGTGRKKVVLTPANAYDAIMTILAQKAVEIEAERQLAEEARNKPGRKWSQPDWKLIAVHPAATIIERLPTKSPELMSLKSGQTLEEMGL